MKSNTPKQSASWSAQGWKRILQNLSRGRNLEAGNDDRCTAGNRQGEKAAQPKSTSRSTNQTSKTDGAKLRGRSKKKWRTATASLQMSSACRKKCAAHHNRYAKVVLLLPTHQPWLPRSDDWKSWPKITTVADGTWDKLLPLPSPPHAQHRQENEAFWERPEHSERICRRRGYDPTSQSENLHQVKTENKIMRHFTRTQTTPSNFLKGLGA